MYAHSTNESVTPSILKNLFQFVCKDQSKIYSPLYTFKSTKKKKGQAYEKIETVRGKKSLHKPVRTRSHWVDTEGFWNDSGSGNPRIPG
ncbi:hypothetical protein TNIN_497821 [Trichonephila inaurata madagascariensis]|uniref:Uncharacterized protein n=1 Tax=Trichonephila inaurata madagascariensis TaxID=2747483 RepID=A0A8X6JRW7_9ARAC|nr:hypothetical protein TNIN_497821 [Trichonephila inaurata madagascariensis]